MLPTLFLGPGVWATRIVAPAPGKDRPPRKTGRLSWRDERRLRIGRTRSNEFGRSTKGATHPPGTRPQSRTRLHAGIPRKKLGLVRMLGDESRAASVPSLAVSLFSLPRPAARVIIAGSVAGSVAGPAARTAQTRRCRFRRCRYQALSGRPAKGIGRSESDDRGTSGPVTRRHKS